jgi:hypothetical protein
MRRTRAAYHYAIRKVKKDVSVICERVADAFLNDDGRNFRFEIKRIRRNKGEISNSVDGLTDVTDIAQLFAAKYRDLYNSVPYDKHEMHL